jgi:hypothetical protein
MSRDEIEAVVAALGELARVVQAADPQDKADIYAKLRLTLTYQPEEKMVQAIVKLGLKHAQKDCVRGSTRTLRTSSTSL